MTIYNGFVIACDEADCPERYFRVGGTWQDAEREAKQYGWTEAGRMHRCATHTAARRARN